MRSLRKLEVKAIAAASAMIALAGCETTTDPAKGGFISGLQNLNNSGYEQRVGERKAAAEDMLDENTRKQRELERVRAQSAALASQRSEAETKLGGLQKDINAMSARLSSGKKVNADLQRQIATLERRVAMAQSNPTTDESAKERQLEQLRVAKEGLEKQVDLAVGR
jgi:chromosome segregation ATPase